MVIFMGDLSTNPANKNCESNPSNRLNNTHASQRRQKELPIKRTEDFLWQI
jgi:hypothetical protein